MERGKSFCFPSGASHSGKCACGSFNPCPDPIAQITGVLKHVPEASASLKEQEGLILSIGVGEVPLIYQATFSVWQNMEAVKQYAYRNPAHGQVVRKTRDRDWYSEEMFTRFRVEGMEGTWDGVKMDRLVNFRPT